MIEQTVLWLEKHWLVNLLLVFVYASFLLFGHSTFVNMSVEVMNYFSLLLYEKLVAIFLLLLGLGAFVAIISMLRTGQVEKRFGVYFDITLLMLVVHFFVLTEMNIEFIHALMYGGLALLLFPLVGRFGGAVVFALPIMLVDEWYQHVVLFPDYTHFFEFNDVVLDLLGAGLFVSALGLIGLESSRSFKPIHKRVEVWLLTSLGMTIAALLAFCVIVPYEVDSCARTWFIMNRLPEIKEFWYVHPDIGSTLHVLKPIEGIVAILILSVAYLGVDSLEGRESSSAV